MQMHRVAAEVRQRRQVMVWAPSCDVDALSSCQRASQQTLTLILSRAMTPDVHLLREHAWGPVGPGLRVVDDRRVQVERGCVC
jgi:hypothetical protein